MNPCKGHECDWCRTCRRGDCCGSDKAPEQTPSKPVRVPVDGEAMSSKQPVSGSVDDDEGAARRYTDPEPRYGHRPPSARVYLRAGATDEDVDAFVRKLRGDDSGAEQ